MDNTEVHEVKSDKTMFLQWLSSLCKTVCEHVVVGRLCIKLFGGQDGSAGLHAVKAEPWAKLWMKLNSCDLLQKLRI